MQVKREPSPPPKDDKISVKVAKISRAISLLSHVQSITRPTEPSHSDVAPHKNNYHLDNSTSADTAARLNDVTGPIVLSSSNETSYSDFACRSNLTSRSKSSLGLDASAGTSFPSTFNAP